MIVFRALSTIAVSAIAIFLGFAVVLFATADPSTEALDQELNSIRNEITTAAEEGAKYTGGLVHGLIAARHEVLRLTEAMLEAKRRAILRRIDLAFKIDGKQMAAASPEELSKIERDIADAQQRIIAADMKAKGYTGGLVQVMALAALETERLTLAQLYLAYYSAKYALAAPRSTPPILREPETPPPAGTIVKDRDAL
jgi:hypothetical protein